MELYANKLFLLNGPAVTVREVTLVSLERRENPKVQTKLVIRTDQTIFCPQGGGQPSDIGTVESSDGKVLADVLFAGLSGSGDVELYCNAASVATASASVEGVAEANLEILEGLLAAGGVVVLKVDVKRRATNCILHSAGHLIDTAVCRLGLMGNLKPGKGYHFPDGPNVEYEVLAEGASTCALLSDLDALTASISEIFRSLVTESVATGISFERRADAVTKLNETLEGYPEVVRLVSIGGHACACGGTHVDNTDKLGSIKIAKAKKKKNVLKISYTLESI